MSKAIPMGVKKTHWVLCLGKMPCVAVLSDSCVPKLRPLMLSHGGIVECSWLIGSC